MTKKRTSAASDGPDARFSRQLMHTAATLYYLQDATQAEIASRLGMSRPTVSRLLSEARNAGVVKIDVAPLHDVDTIELSRLTAERLGLRHVELVAWATGSMPGTDLAPALRIALDRVGLQPGDVLLIASGRTIHDVAQRDLPSLPGVLIVPAVGGQDEPEPWYQANEITRHFAANVGGRPTFLYAPALPGPELHSRLLDDPSTGRVIALWEQARCAVLGIGAPPLQRESISTFIPTDALSLRRAVGDVCLRFFDRSGRPVEFPGSERLISTPLDVLRSVPVTIGLAVGAEKVHGIIAAARAGYINELVTDNATAARLLDAIDGESPDVQTDDVPARAGVPDEGTA